MTGLFHNTGLPSSHVVLNGLKVILQQARRMTWRKQPPVIKRLEGDSAEGVRRTKKERKPSEIDQADCRSSGSLYLGGVAA